MTTKPMRLNSVVFDKKILEIFKYHLLLIDIVYKRVFNVNKNSDKLKTVQSVLFLTFLCY